MITRDQLRRLSARQKVPMGTLERDYILLMVLRAIYHDEDLRDTLVLKGGVALHKLYIGRRLSLDLDFTAQRPVGLDDLREAVEIAEIQAEVKDFRHFHDAFTIQRLRFVGPLDYPSSVKIDVSFRENVLLPPVTRHVESPYFDAFPVTAFQLEEMLAEKLRAGLMRQESRDFYDLWAILQLPEVEIPLALQLLREKLETVGVELDRDVLLDNLDQTQAQWTQDLRILMGTVPDFKQVAADLRTLLAALPL